MSVFGQIKKSKLALLYVLLHSKHTIQKDRHTEETHTRGKLSRLQPCRVACPVLHRKGFTDILRETLRLLSLNREIREAWREFHAKIPYYSYRTLIHFAAMHP